MFPNVRLMIVAMIVSMVAAICGGLALFAAFRVNHEPFARLPSDDPPLQLVFDQHGVGGRTDAIAAPFGVRFQMASRRSLRAASDLAMPSNAPPPSRHRRRRRAEAETEPASAAPRRPHRTLQQRQRRCPTHRFRSADTQRPTRCRSPRSNRRPINPCRPNRLRQTPKLRRTPLRRSMAKTVEKTDRRPSKRHRLATAVRRSRKTASRGPSL